MYKQLSKWYTQLDRKKINKIDLIIYFSQKKRQHYVEVYETYL
jgi:hypothetical protein